MADWIHKEVTYIPHREWETKLAKHYSGYEIINNSPVWTEKLIPAVPTSATKRKIWEKKAREIAEWWATDGPLSLVGFLDQHCVEGWELFKISKDFRGSGDSWCIFRKKDE